MIARMRPPAQRPDDADEPVRLEWEEVEHEAPVEHSPPKPPLGERIFFWVAYPIVFVLLAVGVKVVVGGALDYLWPK
jgi:hypothetical protein